MNYTPNAKKLGLNNNSNLKVMFNEDLSLLPIYQESLISMIQSSLVMEENDSYFKNAHAINCLDILKGLMIGRDEYVQLSKQQKHEDKQRKKNLKRNVNRKIKEMEAEIKVQKKMIAESLKTVEFNVAGFVTELVS